MRHAWHAAQAIAAQVQRPQTAAAGQALQLQPLGRDWQRGRSGQAWLVMIMPDLCGHGQLQAATVRAQASRVVRMRTRHACCTRLAQAPAPATCLAQLIALHIEAGEVDQGAERAQAGQAVVRQCELLQQSVLLQRLAVMQTDA